MEVRLDKRRVSFPAGARMIDTLTDINLDDLVTVKVQAAPPIGLNEIGSTETAAIHAFVMERMRSLVQNPPIGEGVTGL